MPDDSDHVAVKREVEAAEIDGLFSRQGESCPGGEDQAGEDCGIGALLVGPCGQKGKKEQTHKSTGEDVPESVGGEQRFGSFYATFS